jgi:hypothetical protein
MGILCKLCAKFVQFVKAPEFLIEVAIPTF